MPPSPTIGRIVHYVPRSPRAVGPICQAAVITAVTPPDRCELCVLAVDGVFFTGLTVHDADTAAPDTWHWPEREA